MAIGPLPIPRHELGHTNGGGRGRGWNDRYEEEQNRRSGSNY
jgi:hypothetical protein